MTIGVLFEGYKRLPLSDHSQAYHYPPILELPTLSQFRYNLIFLALPIPAITTDNMLQASRDVSNVGNTTIAELRRTPVDRGTHRARVHTTAIWLNGLRHVRDILNKHHTHTNSQDGLDTEERFKDAISSLKCLEHSLSLSLKGNLHRSNSQQLTPSEHEAQKEVAAAAEVAFAELQKRQVANTGAQLAIQSLVSEFSGIPDLDYHFTFQNLW